MNIFAIFKGLSLAKKIGVAVGVVIIIGLIIYTINTFIGRAFDEARNSGKNEIIVETLEKGLEDVKTTQDAVKKLNTDPAVRNSECLRDARNPEDCPSQ